MSLSQRILSKAPLLDKKGRLLRKGYATSFLFSYSRKDVKRMPFSLKEWDFYQFIAYPYCLQATIGHLSYAKNAAITLIDLRDGHKEGVSTLAMGAKKDMEEDPEKENVLSYRSKTLQMSFAYSDNRKTLMASGLDAKGERVEAYLEFPAPSINEKMVIATPFRKKRQFYLNYKENYYGANGYFQIGDRKIELINMNGLLDWGRGVWPYSHEWYWGSLSSLIGGCPFGMNIGWGFGDLSNATENMLFYRRKSYKIDELIVTRDGKETLSPWHLADKEGIVDLTFTPFYDNHTANKMLFVSTHCDQLFGYYEGTVRIDGKTLRIEKTVAFLEHAVNKW